MSPIEFYKNLLNHDLRLLQYLQAIQSVAK